jgi:hypothetical protein
MPRQGAPSPHRQQLPTIIQARGQMAEAERIDAGGWEKAIAVVGFNGLALVRMLTSAPYAPRRRVRRQAESG